MKPLPIDPALPEIVRKLDERGAVVVEAPPGAGKTTRVPRALLDAGVAAAGEIVVLEPRRLAARLSAERVASELGERVGETVGYTVRFDDKASARTRVRFVTEGVLTRRLSVDPELRGVACVVLDELHERHLHGDLALALVRRLRRGPRPDLRVVAMSATLDAGPVAEFLDAEIVRSTGRAFEVRVEHVDAPDDRPLPLVVAGAVRKIVREEPDGDVLVFLPGAYEIQKAREACQAVARDHDLVVMPLFGDLSPEEQDRALAPNARRKVVLATNVAETSITIDGVVGVVDAGLARVAGHAPWSGLSTLEVAKVSRASATQRAGRAGRTRPGRCLRLYTKGDFDARPAYETPEVGRLDLAEAMLSLRAAGVRDASEIAWLDAPPPAAAAAADALLARLGAISPEGGLTETGRALARLPVHPRLARVVVEAARRGVFELGCVAAALLGERSLVSRAAESRESDAATGPSDVLARIELFDEIAAARFDRDVAQRLGVDANVARAIDRARQKLERAARSLARGADAHDPEAALGLAILAGYPDRVARRTRGDGASARRESLELALASGGTATLAKSSVVRAAPLLVAVEADVVRGRGTLVRVASAVSAEDLLEIFPDEVRSDEQATWNAEAERVEVFARMLYGDLVVDEERAKHPDPALVARTLAAAALARGVHAFDEGDALDRLVRRTRFAATLSPAVRAIGDEELREALVALCEGARSFDDLRGRSLVDALRARLGDAGARLVDRLAPERVRVGSREVRVGYDDAKAPFIASRLQDFFGMTEGPKVGEGRVPLVLHLLAPNQRAVQVTQDLAGFWERHYPAIRRELSRRYPRHAWPEDPRARPAPSR